MSDQTWISNLAGELQGHLADNVPTQPRYVNLGYGDGADRIIKDASQRLVYYFEGELGDLQRGVGVAYLPAGKGLVLRDGVKQEGIPIEIRQSAGRKTWEVHQVRRDGNTGTDGRLPSDQDLDRAAITTLDRLDVMRPRPAGGLSFTAPGEFYYVKPSTGQRRVIFNATGSVAAQVTPLTSGQHQAAMLYFDQESGAMAVATATAVTAGGALPSRGEFYDFTFANIAIPSGGIPLANVYLYYGQTVLAEADYYRKYDPRPLFAPSSAVTPTTIATKTANYTLTLTDYTILVDATGGAVTIALPTAASAYNSSTGAGKIYNVKKIDSSGNNMVIDADGAETIDGVENITTATQWNSYTLQSNGVEWFII